jgi:hypothetical protein
VLPEEDGHNRGVSAVLVTHNRFHLAAQGPAMKGTFRPTAAIAIAAFGIACGDPSGSSSSRLTADAVTAAFSTVPLGFSDVSSSYTGDGDGNLGSMWLPGPRSVGFGLNSMMGGGLADAFVGGVSLGGGRVFGHHGPFGGGFTCTGTFANGRLTCTPETRNGLTIARSFAYTNSAGQVQQAFDTATTNTVNAQSSVIGTTSFTRDTTRRNGRGGPGHGHGHGGAHGPIVGDTTTILTATTTVRHTSDRTVTGLAQNSTRRTINATSSGSESSTGTSSRGNFTSTRTAGDTTRGLVVPVVTTGGTYPTAGTVIRDMKASVTYAGQAAVTSTRREVVVYDGSATAKVTITTNGTVKNCTLPLPRGRLSCS